MKSEYFFRMVSLTVFFALALLGVYTRPQLPTLPRQKPVAVENKMIAIDASPKLEVDSATETDEINTGRFKPYVTGSEQDSEQI